MTYLWNKYWYKPIGSKERGHFSLQKIHVIEFQDFLKPRLLAVCGYQTPVDKVSIGEIYPEGMEVCKGCLKMMEKRKDT